MDLEKIKEKLKKEREELILMLENVVKENREVIKEPVFSSDELADKYEYKQEKHIQEDIFKERLRKIDEAIQRINDNKYGLCQKCGKEIEETRLEIDPAVDLCRKCSVR